MRETARLYGLLDRRLADREFVAGDDASIADMAIYRWIVAHQAYRQDLDATPHLSAGFCSWASGR